jgi:hypothetical protein
MPSGFCTRQLRETWQQPSIRERKSVNTYISDLQSHNEPWPPRTSTKCQPTPGEYYVVPKGHFFKGSSRIALTELDPKERSTPHLRHIRKKKKPPNPCLRQTSAKVSQHTQPTIPNKPPCKCRKRNKSRHSRTCPSTADNRFQHNRRTYYPELIKARYAKPNLNSQGLHELEP